ncbi:MAG TPA: class D sortase [Vicinamibacterales bacterium]|nr:class D sortase [Vicinamibacterales bacterium]
MFHLARASGVRQEAARFAAARAAELPEAASPNLTLWSPERIAAWRLTLEKPTPPPLGLLRIARIALEVPILEGTDEWTLNRSVGHIAETAAPGTDGNSGIAGHRDGFFRGLKDVRVGETLELETLRGKHTYRIERIWIVAPEDVTVLDPTPAPSVTLVTCYPFYYIGSAPQRYIVRAVRQSTWTK